MTDEAERAECSVCGSVYDVDDLMITEDNEVACCDCVMTCERCDCIGTSNDTFLVVDGCDYWCESCSDNYSNFCDNCEERHSGDNYTVADSNMDFCERCYGEETYFCEDCGESYRNGCQDHNRDDDDIRLIHDYNYRPDPIFHSTDNNARLYFGMEIEVEAKDGNWTTRDAGAKRAQELEPLEIAYLKSDGSLSCGFEIVTHPMTHNYFHNEIPEFWDTLEALRNEYEMKSWATRTCGLHIHISRTGFNGGAHLHRFLRLVYDNQMLYEKLAGRSSAQWAKFTDNTNYDGQKSYFNKVSNGSHTDRYSAVNCQNRNTVEMRIFKGSLNHNFVKSSLDLAHASVEYTRTLTVRQVREGALNTSNFTKYIQDNAVLYSALNERLGRVLSDVLLSE